jgi:methionine aminotransferase
MTEFRRVHQFIVFTVNTPMQYALNDYMKKKDAYVQLGQFYQEKRDYFINIFNCSIIAE